ncbi:MAG TPA: HEAT repeat domain-containing protein [Elusimicrobiota bacterium]|nr:HEAT repeat domain-containing protein [Elusimicrobiota bacterium]
MPFSGYASFASYTRARYRTLILSAFCMACALLAFAPAVAAQDVDTSSTTRLNSVMTIIRARDPRGAADLATSYAAEPRSEIRAWLVRGAAALDPVAGAALAKTALSDPQPVVRLAAAGALAQARGAASVPDLIAALAGESNGGVRSEIVFRLGSFKIAAARAALAQALAGDPDPNVRAQAARSLQRHGTPAARSALKSAKGDIDPRVRSIANEP